MAGQVKGITIEIGGDTTKLGKALSDSEKKSRDLTGELKKVNNALKFNPGNVELLAQKQQILAQQVGATRDKLDKLRQTEEQVAKQFQNGDIGEEQFRAFQREIIETESKLKNYESQLEAVGKESTALEKLTSTMNAQEQEVSELKEKWKSAVIEYGEGSDEAKNLAKQIDELSSELAENKNKMSELDRSADDLDNSLKDVDGATEKTSGGFTVMKGALADLVSMGVQKAISALKDLGKAAIDAYAEFDEGYDNLIKATGATGEKAASLSDSYKRVSKSIVGDMGDIGATVGEVSTRFDMSGKQLEDTSTLFMKFADITGTDATEAVRLVSRAMGDAQMETGELGSFLDELAAASQLSGVSIDKLTENVTKYGAPMRALGFDTQESIALFSQWEKTGVNTETAFAGMKKAISNWSKEGKDARVEFKKTLDDIEATPNIAEATTKAIEIFGAKAGPDLADAIKGGRFEYKKFLDQLEKSEGTVKKTYDQTQSGADKIKLAIQKMRVEMGDTVKRLADKYSPQIQDALKKASKAFESFAEFAVKAFSFIIDHGSEILGVLKTISVAFVTYKAVTTIQSVVGAFQGLFSAIKAGEGIMSAFNTSLGVAPYALIAAALAGIGMAIFEIDKAQTEAIESTYGLSDAEQEFVDRLHDEAEAYREREQARAENNAAIDAEIGQAKNLWGELQTIVDKNGKIKKGYEDRAAVITGLLSDALGTEITIVDGQIQKYDELKGTIDEVIDKKRAESLLDANKEAYSEAISGVAQAYSDYTDAIDKRDEAQGKLNEATKKYNDLQIDYWKTSDVNKRAEITDDMKEQGKIVDTLTTSLDKQKQAVKDASDKYSGYASTIKNYDGLLEAVASGDVAKMNVAMDNLSNSFMTADTATRESLENQVERFKQSYQQMKTAVDNGMPGVTQSQVDAMADMVAKAEAELDKLPPEMGNTATEGGEWFIENFGRFPGAAEAKGKEISDKTNAGLGSADTGATGKSQVDKYNTGVAGQKDITSTTAIGISDANNTGLGSADTGATGANQILGFNAGAFGKQGAVNSTGSILGGSLNSGLGSVDTQKTGMQKAGGYVSGAQSKYGASRTTGTTLANQGKQGYESVDTTPSGKNFSQGLINGMNSLKDVIGTTAGALASIALGAVRKTQKEGSPSKITTQSGIYFAQGYINGIRSKISDAVKAAKELTSESLGAMDTNIGFDDSTFNGATFERQMQHTFDVNSPSMGEVVNRLERVENAILNSRSQIVLDTGVLVGETINKIDSGLAGVYQMKARGV